MTERELSSTSGIRIDLAKIEGRRRRAQARMWSEVVERERRAERARVVPLPLAVAAVLFPFFAAWAAAGPTHGPGLVDPVEGAAAARPLPDALTLLGRDDRAPDASGGYVDVWGPLEPWEAETLRRRGHVEPGR